MGDAANNPGMVQIRRAISKRLEGTYVTNIALGSNRAQDAGNTFFLSMDGEVEQFADRVCSLFTKQRIAPGLLQASSLSIEFTGMVFDFCLKT